MSNLNYIAIIVLVLLCGCNAEPVAKAKYKTPNDERELYAFPPPEIKNPNDLSEVTKVNIVFCRWGEDTNMKNILLHCNFDIAPQKQLAYRRPTFLEMKTRWKQVDSQNYEMTSFRLKTPSREIKILEERQNCSAKNCGLDIRSLKLPKSFQENLEFDFVIQTIVSEKNGKEKYNTKIAFEGFAPRNP